MSVHGRFLIFLFFSRCSVSSLLTTTEAVITELPKDDGPAFSPGGGMPGMGGMGGMDY